MRANFSWQVDRALASLPHIFCMKNERMKLRPKIRVCAAYTSRRGCIDRSSCFNIHICPGFIFGDCELENCSMGHRLHTNHNARAIQAFYLRCLSDSQLCHFIKVNEETLQRETTQRHLDVCRDYNKEKCNKSCGALHICLDFVLRLGDCSRPTCLLSHDPFTSKNYKLLQHYDFDLAGNLWQTLTAIICRNPRLQQMQKNAAYQRKHIRPHDKHTNSPRRETLHVNKQSIGATSEKSRNINRNAETSRTNVWSHLPEGSPQIPEICYKSLSRTCEVTGCPRLHSEIHFHWQVTEDFDTWYNFPKKHVTFLEKQFCNPENNLVNLQRLDRSCQNKGLLSLLKCHPWKIVFNFTQWDNNCACIPIIYRDKEYYIRRLCTERNPTQKLRANRFIWYFQDDSQKWRPFDLTDNKRLEDAYQQTPDGNCTMQIGVARYIVDFRKMNQKNVSTTTIRNIRRRPLTS
ncbi:protein mono-ADP-ribosyltransferase PARP12-like [Penaeus indicus]|uniref:protein mono-ADP-ribosyltransferase PARP12-like n=1 Tax=Penaeus indicus TaxID=29960 RepID=UPI00300CC4C5